MTADADQPATSGDEQEGEDVNPAGAAGENPAAPAPRPGGDGAKDPPAGNGEPPPSEPLRDADVLVTEQIRSEVRDALELADFIVKTGARKLDGRALGPEGIRVIKVTAGDIKLFEDPKEPVYIKASDWTRFEFAYYALVQFAYPVTVQTLRNTRETGETAFTGISAAQKFTRLLWVITIAFAVIVIVSAAFAAGVDGGSLKGKNTFYINECIKIIVPYAYGGLGACAYLLRTAHSLIAERSFDLRRKPEYINRVLLGTVSGGAIVLLFNPSGDDETVKISAAALGFVAGYSNDLLFSAIERVVAALLPRVGLDTLKRESAVARQPLELSTGGMTLKDLMDRMENAKPEDKELYKTLLAKLRDRL